MEYFVISLCLLGAVTWANKTYHGPYCAVCAKPGVMIKEFDEWHHPECTVEARTVEDVDNAFVPHYKSEL